MSAIRYWLASRVMGATGRLLRRVFGAEAVLVVAAYRAAGREGYQLEVQAPFGRAQAIRCATYALGKMSE